MTAHEWLASFPDRRLARERHLSEYANISDLATLPNVSRRISGFIFALASERGSDLAGLKTLWKWVTGTPPVPLAVCCIFAGVILGARLFWTPPDWLETDWAVATASVNWKFTRAETWVEFERDEPICHDRPGAP